MADQAPALFEPLKTCSPTEGTRGRIVSDGGEGTKPEPETSTSSSSGTGIVRSNSAGSVLSLRSFLRPGVFEHAGSNESLDVSQMKTEEVVAGWALSLRNLLVDPNGVCLFQRYCAQLLCEENLLFWQSVEAFKEAEDDEQIQGIGTEIFNEFILFTGKHQVNLNSKTSKAVKEAYKQKPLKQDLFDACQTEIYNLMKTDSYRKFLQSEMYKEVLCMELDGRPLPWQEQEPAHRRKVLKGFLSFLRKDKRKSASTAPSQEELCPTNSAKSSRSRSSVSGLRTPPMSPRL